MVGFVVDDQDVLQAHQIGHDPLDHLAFGFQGVEFLSAALQERAAALRRAPCVSRSLKAW